jgi:hypothetical protein
MDYTDRSRVTSKFKDKSRCILWASLGTTFFHGISIFTWENELISLRKMEITWENVVPKLALYVLGSSFKYMTT